MRRTFKEIAHFFGQRSDHNDQVVHAAFDSRRVERGSLFFSFMNIRKYRCVLKSKIYKYPKNLKKFELKSFLSFSSEIQVFKKKNNFVMIDKNKWLFQKDIKKIHRKEKNFIKILKLFLNCKYKWGGKTYNGIDCSALIQLFYKFNNKFFPRDTVDQIKYKKVSIIKKKFKKGDIIFWKGHVAICINSKELITLSSYSICAATFPGMPFG